MLKIKRLICGVLTLSLTSLSSIAIAEVPSASSAPQEVLDAAKAGRIDLGKEYPQKPWLMIHTQKGNNDNYIFLDQNNQKLPIDYLTDGLSQKPLISGSLINFIFIKSIAVWNTKTETFKMPDFGELIGSSLLYKNYLYMIRFQNLDSLACNVYEIDVRTLSSRTILVNDTNNNLSLCDLKTKLVYVDNKSLWSLWGHGSSGGLTVYHNSFDLKTGKKVSNVTLEEDYEHGYVISSVVDFTQELPTKENQHTEVYQCQFKEVTKCPLRESNFARQIYNRSNRVLEQYLPYSIDKEIPYIIHPKNLSLSSKHNYLKCGNFEYDENWKPGNRLLFRGSQIKKEGMETISMEDLDCVQ